MLKDLASREDVHHLVSTFYVDVRKDELLGPIFNRAIPDDLWPWHIDKLTDFWETNIFGKHLYSGNPKERHQSVDRMENGSITQAHFGRWIQLWFQTLDSHFEGPNVDIAKERARRMATGLFMGIASSRAASSSN